MICGPAGAGKGSIVSELVESDPRLWLSRSWTTRPRRPSEPADAYTFVDRGAFEAKRDAGGFLEWDEHFGALYGTPLPTAPPGRDVLLEIDVRGAEQVAALHPDALVIFVAPPSREAQEARLRGRGDSEEQVARRLARAEMEDELGRRLARHVVVNDVLSRATEEVAGILADHRSSSADHRSSSKDPA